MAARQTTGGRKAGQGSKWLRPATRQALYLRDGFCCAYCGAAADEGAPLTVDHLLACDLGGDNSPSNLVTACLRCNSRKRALTLRAWFALLRDDGVDTTQIGSRIRRMVRRPLDRDAARRILAARG